MRVFYFTEAKWALDDIKNEWLKVCRFSGLNDPFELLAADMRDRCQRVQMRERADEIDRRDGLLCFCKDWRNPLMWSHYADRHRGICLGFDVDEKILQKINYRLQRLRLSARATKEIDNLLLTTKFSRWCYEEECRVIVPLKKTEFRNELYFRRFDPSIRLTSVIAGPRCATKEEEVIAALGNRTGSVEVFKSRLAFRSFRVVRNREAWTGQY